MIWKRMVRSSFRYSWIFLLGIVLFSCQGEEEVDPMEVKKSVLPILGNRDVEYKMVDGVEVADTVYHQIPEFEYIDHDSVTRTQHDFKGRVWVTDFFFSHCPTICPPMTSQMNRLANNTQDISKHVQFLSFSIDPDRDTPSRLREYRKTYDIKAKNWSFMTGVHEDKTHLMAKEYFNGAQRDENADGGFGHTSYFSIVDQEGYVRGIYDGTDPDAVDQLEKDLRKLLKEEYKLIK